MWFHEGMKKMEVWCAQNELFKTVDSGILSYMQKEAIQIKSSKKGVIRSPEEHRMDPKHKYRDGQSCQTNTLSIFL